MLFENIFTFSEVLQGAKSRGQIASLQVTYPSSHRTVRPTQTNLHEILFCL